MAFNTKINLSDERVYQLDGQLLTLSGDTVIAPVGTIKYETHPNFTGDTQVVDKKYVDDAVVSGVTGGTIYSLASPATTTVGGVTAGTTLTGKNSNEILSEILTPFQTPSFSSFTTDKAPAIVEVGCVLSGTATFNWGFNNGTNISDNTLCIMDITNSNTLIATNISTSPTASPSIATKTFTSCLDTQRWCGIAKDTKNASHSSAYETITSYLPYYWGTCSAPGSAGENRPTTLTPAEIVAGTKVLADSSGKVSINFNSTNDDYIWFAVPATVNEKNCWQVSGINFGEIGGTATSYPVVQPNLFPSPETVNNVATACWSGQIYEVYISNAQSSSSSLMDICRV